MTVTLTGDHDHDRDRDHDCDSGHFTINQTPILLQDMCVVFDRELVSHRLLIGM
jgi:hypothetical protein